MNDTASAISQLRSYRDKHLELGPHLWRAGGGVLYPLDLLATATLNRSVCLIRGYCDLIGSHNFVAAVPLLRLQIDNYLRFSAAWLVADPHELAMQVLKGNPVKDQRDMSEHRMTDAHLVKILAQKHPWLPNAYKEACAYVHLSEQHILNAVTARADSDGRGFTAKISDNDEFVPDTARAESVEVFDETTKAILTLVRAWAYAKEHPESLANPDVWLDKDKQVAQLEN